MKQSAKRDIIILSVAERMRYYLGCHPDQTFRTACDLTLLVAQASKTKTLELWLQQMRELTPNYTPGKPAIPKSRDRRKSVTPKGG